MTKCICTIDTVCPDHIYGPTKANQKSGKPIWAGLKQLAGTIGEYAVEVYRYSNEPEPIFTNGGPRVLIRPGRIDLV
jgi:hypothetical protein